MQRILGYMRKAIQEFDLIHNGDRIAVGVSGGKDSVVLLTGLALLRRFIGIDYQLEAITLDPRFGGVETDYSPIAELCARLEVPWHLIPTDIGQIVFDIRKEPNPCSLCAKMRRGALHDAAKELDCNVIALGHHYDDVVETFVMNLFNEGRIGCFSPKSYLSRKELWMIRPLVFAPEKEIRRAAAKNNLPIVKSKCPADGHTSRQDTKEFLAQKERESDGFKLRLFGALRRSGVDGWGYPAQETRRGAKASGSESPEDRQAVNES
ncbi:MAG: tRNA 2-thiocytidine biosynthesis TtcA family protein [Oscillospiraceae bacterium]|nr:tRNA 2-thiocytidine biosynthesis TtcA family protein [Oscillospiraceae bacterium]